MFDGISIGGFNIIDIEKIFSSTGIPCATVTRERPDFDSMLSALKKNFDDWETRYSMIRRNPLYKIGTKHRPIYATAVGMDIDRVEEMINECTVQGALPEPLRIAHLISSAMILGESHGRA